MEQYSFIFSNQYRHRLHRHVVFWFCWWLFSTFLYSFSGGILTFGYIRRLPLAAFESFFYLVPHMFLSYALMYFVIPRFLLRGKYTKTLGVVLLLFVATAVLSTTLTRYLLAPVRRAILDIPVQIYTYDFSFFLGMLAGLRGVR